MMNFAPVCRLISVLGSVIFICANLPALAQSDSSNTQDQGSAQVDAKPLPGSCVETLPETRPRRRPGYPILTFEPPPCDPSKPSKPSYSILTDPPPVPDRWRIVDSLGYEQNWLDPYSGNNPLKADRPVIGDDWFFNLSLLSDTTFEPRRFPTPVGNASTNRPNSLDIIGKGEQFVFIQNLIIETVLYKGNTVYMPPDHEFRFIPVLNANRVDVEEVGVLKANPAEGTERNEEFIGIQELFWDKHTRDVTDRYDFDSFRIGIQPFSSDFRGFLFQDNQFGVRYFGNRNNNIYLYNLAWFRRIEKDTNSGLNDLERGLRDDDVFTANLYKQDWPQLGFVSEFSFTYNRNRENKFYFDKNNFIARPASIGTERPREYDVYYPGFNGDGHFGPLNLTTSAYLALGRESRGTFVDESTDIQAYFFAAEASRDFDWIRLRGSFLHASGDDDPFDDKAEGFDAIFENPQFAGGETSFFIRQPVPLIGGGRVALSGRNGILPSLRSSKEEGQSNFTNPGLWLLGIGADLDLTPQTRLSFNINQLWFAETEVLKQARNQATLGRNIGQDISAALIWRPFATQNIVVRLSAAALIPGSGWRNLYGDSRTPYSVLGNVLFAY